MASLGHHESARIGISAWAKYDTGTTEEFNTYRQIPTDFTDEETARYLAGQAHAVVAYHGKQIGASRVTDGGYYTYDADNPPPMMDESLYD